MSRAFDNMRFSLQVSYPPVPHVLGISPHGIFAAIGIAVAVVLLNQEVRRREPSLLPVVDAALMWAIPAGIVGARLDYVVSHLRDFSSVTSAIAIWDGGLALFGGLLAGGIAAGIVLHRRGAQVARVFDIAAPAFAIAIAVGRIGDLLIVDHLGKPTRAAFALAYQVKPGYHLAPGYGTTSATPPGLGQSCQQVGDYFAGCTYHLTAAYDLLGAAALAAVLMAVRWHVRLRSGSAICIFAIWYGAQRLGVDFTRGIDEHALLGMSGTQLIAVVWVAVAATLLAVIRIRGRGLGDRPDSLPSRSAPLDRATQRASVP